MDNQPLKKKAERELLNQFIAAYPHFPKGKIYASESPDFIVKSNRKRTLGIELIALILKPDFTARNFTEQLQSALFKKEEKLKLYRKKILENYWLLITAPDLSSPGFNIRNLLEKPAFESGFDAVFLLDSKNRKVYVLK